MMGKSHVVGGAGIAGIVCGGVRYGLRSSDAFYERAMPVLYHAGRFLFPYGTDGAAGVLYAVFAAACFLFGTLAPDMDNPDSILGRRFYIPAGHRGIMHSVWPVVLLFAVSCAAGPLRPLAFAAIGYSTHLLLDAPSATGIPLLWPFRGRHRFRLYSTGEITEYIFLGFVLIVAGMCMFAGFRP